MPPDLIPPNPTPQDFCKLHNACASGGDFACKFPTMADVWDNCQSVDWLLWICSHHQVKLEDKALRLFAVWCARSTPLGDGRVTGDLLSDPRSTGALNVAERFANGEANQQELDAAESAAWSAAWSAARSVWWSAAESARSAAESAAESARSAAESAAWSAARSVWWSAAESARSAAESARSVQCSEFRKFIPNPFKL